jgi:glutathione-regulated potassium-efflux system ancillary protein KefG
MKGMSKKILLNVFHPNLSKARGNQALVKAVQSMPNLTCRDLYAEYPDCKIDVKREQDLLLTHDLLVFQHPIYWYNCPSLFKEWLDRVLEQGFAFPPGVGDKLNGKSWLTAITTGGAQDAYRSGGRNNFTISELLRPFQQTANLSGMKWLPPFVVHSVLPSGIVGYKNISDTELQQHATDYRTQLEEYSR